MSGSEADPGSAATVEFESAKPTGVVTWNVQHASVARSTRQADWLARRGEADVVVLTEVAAGIAGDHLANALSKLGYTTHLTEHHGTDYRVLVAVRTGRLEPLAHIRVEHLGHRLACAAVTLPDQRRLGVVGIYVPSRGPKARRNVAKRIFQAAVADALPAVVTAFGPGVPVVVAGDLNVVEPGHVPHHSVFGSWEYDFYRAFVAAGLTDVFRHQHPAAVEHSWFGRAGVGYRLDHIFCSDRHIGAISNCRYLHEPRTSGLSDHSALALTITPPPVGS